MRPAAMPIQVFTLRERVESLMRAKPKAAMNAMMALLLRVRSRVDQRKSVGHTQAVFLRARLPASRAAQENGNASALGWRRKCSRVRWSGEPERRDALSGAS